MAYHIRSVTNAVTIATISLRQVTMSDNPDKYQIRGLEDDDYSLLSERPSLYELDELMSSLHEWNRFALYLLRTHYEKVIAEIEDDHTSRSHASKKNRSL